MTLRFKITLWLLAAAMTSAGIFSLLFYRAYSRNIEAIAINEMQGQLENVERYLDDSLEDLFNAANIVESNGKLQKMIATPEKPIDYYHAYDIKAAIRSVQESYRNISTIDVYLSDYNYLATSDYGAIPLINSPEVSAELQRLTRETRGIIYSDQYVQNMPKFTSRNLEQITLLTPLYAAQVPRKAGLIAVSIKKSDLCEYLGGIDSMHICVLRDGELLLADQSGDNSVFALVSQCADELAGNQSLTTRINGERVVLHSRTMKNTNWQLASIFYLDQAVARSDETSQYLILLFLSSGAITLVAVMLVFSLLFSRLQTLSAGMKRVEAGDLQVRLEPPAGTKDEFSYIYTNFNSMVGRIRELFDELYNQKMLQKDMQIKLLQSQINPHFIYNIFENMNWFVQLERYDELEELIYSVTEYYRKSLNNGRDLISVQDTASLLRAYLDIQHIRFRSRLNYELTIESGLEETLLLNHIVQPLVENAVHHGVETSVRPCTIWVRFETAGAELCITVEDNGSGMEPERLDDLRQRLAETTVYSEGYFALTNVNTRIKLYYGEGYGITIKSTPGHGTCTQLHLPLHCGHNQLTGGIGTNVSTADC